MITRLAHRQLANAAPSIGRRWLTDSQIEPLIGTREQIEQKRKQFEDKYADALKAAAKKRVCPVLLLLCADHRIDRASMLKH